MKLFPDNTGYVYILYVSVCCIIHPTTSCFSCMTGCMALRGLHGCMVAQVTTSRALRTLYKYKLPPPRVQLYNYTTIQDKYTSTFSILSPTGLTETLTVTADSILPYQLLKSSHRKRKVVSSASPSSSCPACC